MVIPPAVMIIVLALPQFNSKQQDVGIVHDSYKIVVFLTASKSISRISAMIMAKKNGTYSRAVKLYLFLGFLSGWCLFFSSGLTGFFSLCFLGITS